MLNYPEAVTLAVLRRLAPRSRITVGAERIELALANLDDESRRGRSDDPHGPLLAGAPPLNPDGSVAMVEFHARRPFHPQRLHDAIDLLLDGVIRSRGRLWLANRSDQAMWLESAGGGLRVSSAGKWVAAMSASEAAYIDPERRAFAEPDVGRRLRRPAHLDDGPGVRRASRRDPRRPARRLADRRGVCRTGDWVHYDDPFGDWHEDPCNDAAPVVSRRNAGARKRRDAMKPGIHPDYHPVVFQDATTGKLFLTRSTITAHASSSGRRPMVSGLIPWWSSRSRRTHTPSGRAGAGSSTPQARSKSSHRRYGTVVDPRRTGLEAADGEAS